MLFFFYLYRQDEDIELQMLRSQHLSTRSQSDNESVISLECHKPNSSTIGILYLNSNCYIIC